MATVYPVGIVLSNDGFGPARVQPFTVKVDGTVVGNWEEAIDKLAIDNKYDWITSYEIYGEDIPWKEGTMRHVFGLAVDSEDYTQEREDIILEAIERIEIHVRYSSMYGETWDVSF